MELITSLNIATVSEISLTVAFVYALTQAIKQTKIDNKWLPWISMFLGILGGLISVLITSDKNYLEASFMGFLIGGFTSGLFDGFSGFLKNAKDESAKIVATIPSKKINSVSDQSSGNNVQGLEIKDGGNIYDN